MAPLFVVDYEELKRIASAFDREADRLRQSFQQVLSKVEVLESGDWFGQGAAAFYREMRSDVLPAMKSLPSALDAAGRTTRDIAQNTKDAEDEIVRLFAGLFGLGSAAAIAAAVGAGIGQALGTAAGAVAGAAQAVAAAAAAAQAAAAGRMLSGFDPKVAEIARSSPSLQANLAQLERDGWTITRRNGGGSETDSQNRTVVIDTSESAATQVGSLAHESAHALHGPTTFHRPTADMTRDQFIQRNLRENMLDEANSQFTEAAVRQEVLGNGGPDTGVSGTQSADYQRIYNDFHDGNITREQAVGQMADIFPNETTGTTGQTYRDYYSPTYADWWDANAVPTAGGGR
jgi:WXG100 family type VII secretion target